MAWFTTWTDGQIAELKALWIAGPSAAVIARKLGKTRNAVLGKVHRLKLEQRSNRNGTYYGPERETIPHRATPRKINRQSVFKSPDAKPAFIPPNPNARPGLLAIMSPITGAYLNTVRRKGTMQPEYTKDQLRAQLAQAMINTAALV